METCSAGVMEVRLLYKTAGTSRQVCLLSSADIREMQESCAMHLPSVLLLRKRYRGISLRSYEYLIPVVIMHTLFSFSKVK